jgi:hypothetical protein
MTFDKSSDKKVINRIKFKETPALIKYRQSVPCIYDPVASKEKLHTDVDTGVTLAVLATDTPGEHFDDVGGVGCSSETLKGILSRSDNIPDTPHQLRMHLPRGRLKRLKFATRRYLHNKGKRDPTQEERGSFSAAKTVWPRGRPVTNNSLKDLRHVRRRQESRCRRCCKNGPCYLCLFLMLAVVAGGVLAVVYKPLWMKNDMAQGNASAQENTADTAQIQQENDNAERPQINGSAQNNNSAHENDSADNAERKQRNDNKHRNGSAQGSDSAFGNESAQENDSADSAQGWQGNDNAEEHQRKDSAKRSADAQDLIPGAPWSGKFREESCEARNWSTPVRSSREWRRSYFAGLCKWANTHKPLNNFTTNTKQEGSSSSSSDKRMNRVTTVNDDSFLGVRDRELDNSSSSSNSRSRTDFVFRASNNTSSSNSKFKIANKNGLIFGLSNEDAKNEESEYSDKTVDFTSLGRYPYVVSLSIGKGRRGEGGGIRKCSGTILDDRHILTAASCLDRAWYRGADGASDFIEFTSLSPASSLHVTVSAGWAMKPRNTMRLVSSKHTTNYSTRRLCETRKKENSFIVNYYFCPWPNVFFV